MDGDIPSLVKDDEANEDISQADLYKEIYSNLILIVKASGPFPPAAVITAPPSSTVARATPT